MIHHDIVKIITKIKYQIFIILIKIKKIKIIKIDIINMIAS